MKPKDFFIFIILIPLGLSFIVISCLLYFNNGKSRKLIAAKLKLGALLLTFSWFTACNKADNNNGKIFSTTCYMWIFPEYNNITFLHGNDSVKISKNDTLKLSITDPTCQIYYYKVKSLTNLQQKGFIDGNYKSDEKEKIDFNININDKIKPGKYYLEIYGITGPHKNQLGLTNALKMIEICTKTFYIN